MALNSVSGAAVIGSGGQVTSIKTAVLVVRKARPQACGHVYGLKIARVAAAWRRFRLGVEALLRQSFDDPQRIARPLVEVDDVVFVVARPMTDRCAVLECWVCFCAGAAADPGGSGT